MRRALNIALRTAHLGAVGILLGGCAFDVAPERLTGSLWLTVGTGFTLAAIEAGPHLLWFHQGRGLMTLGKLGLLCAVPLAWDHRLPILLAALAVASVGSHMPGRFRHYSMVQRRVIHEMSGPGGRQAQADGADAGG
jgi:hypothetical protein